MKKNVILSIFLLINSVVCAQLTFDKYIDSMFLHAPIAGDHNSIMDFLKKTNAQYNRVEGNWVAKTLEGEKIQCVYHQFMMLHKDSSRYIISVIDIIRDSVLEYSGVSLSMFFTNENQVKSELNSIMPFLNKLRIEGGTEDVEDVNFWKIDFLYEANKINFLGFVITGTNNTMNSVANHYFVLNLKRLVIADKGEYQN